MSSDNPILIYIVGRGHSGSTMLELLLNRSSNIAAMGEIDMLGLQIYRDQQTRWVGNCSCGSRPQACEYWGRIIGCVHQEFGVNMTTNPFGWRISDVGVEEEYGLRAPFAWSWYKFHRLVRTIAYRGNGQSAGPFTRIYRSWIENRDYVASKYASFRDVSAVVDSSKDPLQMRDIVAHSRLRVKVLFLTRDVRALAWSAVRKGRSSAKSEAASWAKLNNDILRFLRGIDTDLWMQVSYEQLCSDTEKYLDKIHRFIDLPRIALSHEEELDRRHTIAGNRTRLRALTTISEDQGWIDNLSAEQIDVIRSEAGSAARQFGYEI